MKEFRYIAANIAGSVVTVGGEEVGCGRGGGTVMFWSWRVKESVRMEIGVVEVWGDGPGFSIHVCNKIG